MTGQEHANARLAAALRYARANWPVFPCILGEKIPATKHGFLDATTDLDKITWWWARNPERNVAIATGLPGPDVLDVDVHEDGNGFAAFNRLHREGLLNGASAYIRTPSGGLHAYLTGSEQGNGRLPHHHLDFRSKGGYVVAPPSQVNGTTYELVKQTDGQGGLDWPPSPGCSNLNDGNDFSGPDRGPPTPTGWPSGWHASTKATATTACSGPPSAPSKPASPTSANWQTQPATPG